MKKKIIMAALILGIMTAAAIPAGAETLTTADGVLSIDTPSDQWAAVSDPNHWFALTDGKNAITVDHFSNGEKLPAVEIADTVYPAVSQYFVSTQDEVFVVTGEAASQEALGELMTMMGTVKVLQYGTKTAIQKESEAASASDFSLRLINALYYVTTDELNVRSGCSTDDAVVGTLHYGDQVTVTGAVTKGDADYGWYQVQFNGGSAYVSSSFLSQTKPAEKEQTKTDAQTTSGKKAIGSAISVYRADGSYVGELIGYDDGHYYIGEVPFDSNGDGTFFGGAGAGMTVYTYDAWAATYKTGTASAGNLVQCEYCGQWFEAGNDYRNHVSAAHGNAGSSTSSTNEGSQQHGLESQGSGRPVTISFYGGAWFDENGVEFYDQNNGTFVDSSNGDVFNVVW